jgi:predicted aspartyl protease
VEAEQGAKGLVAEIPFRLVDNSIVLTLRLNDSDRELSFLFDTGANGLAIRRDLADSLGIAVSYSQQAGFVGGSSRVQISSGNLVHLTNRLSFGAQNIAIFDNIRRGMDGIIGLNLIRHHVARIDFDRQTISLYNFGEGPRDGEGEIKNGADNDNGNGTVSGADEIAVPITMRGGMMFVPSVLSLTGDTAVRADFLFDTGANYSLIVFSDFVRDRGLLVGGFKPESIGTTVSMGLSTPVYHGRASELSVGDVVVTDLPVTLQTAKSRGANGQSGSGGAGDTGGTGNSIDGSLGIRFWSRYNITVDMLKQEIYLSSRNNPS